MKIQLIVVVRNHSFRSPWHFRLRNLLLRFLEGLLGEGIAACIGYSSNSSS